MPRIAYIDGAYRHLSEAAICAEDRGYQFADGIYEVWALRGGRLLDAELHFTRLTESLAAIDIPSPMPRASLQAVIAETVRRNRLIDGLVYCQITRGIAPREHAIAPNLKPIVTVTAKPIDPEKRAEILRKGVRVITHADERWRRCDIKSIALLPNVLARHAAQQVGAQEAWLVDGKGYITEGAAANAWIVDGKGRLRTRPLGAEILPGVTRHVIAQLARDNNIQLVEEPFTLAEALAARECFSTASTLTVLPVTHIDGTPIGNGKPGAVAVRLSQLYDEI